MKDKVGVHFQSRKRSVKGAVGFWLSIAGAVFMILLVLLSVLKDGEGGILLGFLGFFLLVLFVFSFFLSLKGLRERDVFTGLPMAGLIISGLSFFFLFCLYISGIPWKS